MVLTEGEAAPVSAAQHIEARPTIRVALVGGKRIDEHDLHLFCHV
jgi:hypothetical protein